MQVAASKEKRRGRSGTSEGTHDPHYENIALAFRNRDQPKGGSPLPSSQAPAQPRPSSDTAQIPQWLRRAVMILYVLLTLIFLFCVFLSVTVLVKNAQMSKEILSLREELLNASNLAQECQEDQRKDWKAVKGAIEKVTNQVSSVQNQVQAGKQKLDSVSAEITNIQRDVKVILEKVQKENSQPTTSS